MWSYGFFMSSAGAFFSSYLSLYILALGGTRREVGWLTSAANFMGMLGPIPGAALTRHSGKPRQIVVLFSILHRVPLLLAALAPLILSGPALIYTVIGLLALRLGLLSAYNPAFISLMGAIVPEGIRGRYLGARKMAMAMASAALVPVAGWIIDSLVEPLGYQVSLGIAVALGLLAAWSVARIPDFQVRTSVEEQKNGGTFWEALTSSRTFLLFVLIRLFWNFAHQIGGPYFRVYQKEVLLTPARTIGILITVSAITRLIGQRFWGNVVDRAGARWVLDVCALIIPVLPFIWIVATKPWHIVFVILPSGFLWAGFRMGALNLLLELPDLEHRTQCAAAHVTAIRMANIAGPLVGNVVIQQWGYHWSFALSGIGRLIGALLFAALLRPFAKQAFVRSKARA
ncbi:MAG: MFS transporter [Anaerolineae bacterium]